MFFSFKRLNFGPTTWLPCFPCFQKRPPYLISLKQADNGISQHEMDWKRGFQVSFCENERFEAQNRDFKSGLCTLPCCPSPRLSGMQRNFLYISSIPTHSAHCTMYYVHCTMYKSRDSQVPPSHRYLTQPPELERMCLPKDRKQKWGRKCPIPEGKKSLADSEI
jgi:hypothetical protein